MSTSQPTAQTQRRPTGFWTRARVFAAASVAAVFVILIGVVAALRINAERIAIAVLERNGVAPAALAIDRLGVSGAVLRDVSLGRDAAGAPAIEARALRVRYSPAGLLAGRVRSIDIDGATIRLAVDEAGRLDIGLGLAPSGEPAGEGAAGAEALPFDVLQIGDGAVLLATPYGDAQARVEGGFAAGQGGSASLKIAPFTWTAEGAEIDVRDARAHLEFTDDGGASLAIAIGGAGGGAGVSAEAIALGMQAHIEDWRVLLDDSAAMEILVEGGVSAESVTTTELAVNNPSVQGRLRVSKNAHGVAVRAEADDGACVDAAAPSFDAAGTRLAAPVLWLCETETPLLRIDRGGAVVAAARLTAPGVSATGAWGEMVGAPPRLEIHFDGQRLSIAAAGGSLASDQGVVVRGLDAHAEIAFADAPVWTAELRAARLVDTATPMRIGPVTASGAAQGTFESLAFSFDVMEPGGFRLAAATGVHDIATSVGMLTIEAGPMAVAPGEFEPLTLFPSLAQVIAAPTGAAVASARLDWSPAGLRSTGRARVTDLGFVTSTALNAVQGLSGEIVFDSLAPLRTKGVQKLTVDAIDIGIVLTGGEIDVAYDEAQGLHVQRAEWPWADGRIGLYESVIPLDAERVELALRADNVDVSEALEEVKIDGLVGTGRVSGAIPVVFEDGKARVDSGQLRALGEGVIQYTGDAGEIAAATSEQSNLLFKTLENFQYKDMVLRVDGDLADVIFVAATLAGHNDDVLSGHPFEINVTAEAPIAQLLDQARLGADVRAQIRRARETQE